MNNFKGKKVIVRFQFHIVRLKERDEITDECICDISIPYSSIKRIRLQSVLFFANQFQFHIVRLKASYLYRLFPARLISIPYSSIKSLHKK